MIEIDFSYRWKVLIIIRVWSYGQTIQVAIVIYKNLFSILNGSFVIGAVDIPFNGTLDILRSIFGTNHRFVRKWCNSGKEWCKSISWRLHIWVYTHLKTWSLCKLDFLANISFIDRHSFFPQVILKYRSHLNQWMAHRIANKWHLMRVIVTRFHLMSLQILSVSSEKRDKTRDQHFVLSYLWVRRVRVCVCARN